MTRGVVKIDGYEGHFFRNGDMYPYGFGESLRRKLIELGKEEGDEKKRYTSLGGWLLSEEKMVHRNEEVYGDLFIDYIYFVSLKGIPAITAYAKAGNLYGQYVNEAEPIVGWFDELIAQLKKWSYLNAPKAERLANELLGELEVVKKGGDK